MSQLPDQLLKSANIRMMMQMNPNMNLLNQVGMPQTIPTPQNIPQNPNMGMGVPVPDQKSQPNQDTSNYFS
jgi:hypothetical protein